MINADMEKANTIYDVNGQLDARAFKRLMYEKEAGTATGSKAFMAGATSARGGYAPDSYLLNGLAVHGLTFQQLLDANLRNIDPRAYAPISKPYNTADEFVEKVQVERIPEFVRIYLSNLSSKIVSVNRLRYEIVTAPSGPSLNDP